MPAAAAILHERHPSVDLRLTEAEPPEALRMLRAGYVDVALIFRHETADGTRTGTRDIAAGEDEDDPVAAMEHEDLREQLPLSEAVHLIMPDMHRRRRAAACPRRDRAVGGRPGPAGGPPLDRRL